MLSYTPQANAFAYIALFSWPLMVFLLFRKLPRNAALIWSILGGYLLLPFGVAVKIKMIPAFDKDLLPAVSAAVMCLLLVDHSGTRRRAARNDPPASPSAVAASDTPVARSPYARRQASRSTAAEVPGAAALERTHGTGARLLDLLLALLLLTPFATALTNGHPVQAGPTVLPGLQLYDAFSMISEALMAVLPFLLARRYLARPEDHALLLRLLCVGGLLYSLPTLFEVRMSPQLSRWIYGFLAQSFLQAVRDGGYRPVVFLQHGLWLAIFLAMTALAGVALWRHERARSRPTHWLLAGVYLAIVLALCKSLGALAILLLLAPAVLFLSVRAQLVAAMVVALSILTYPVLRGANLVPVDTIYSFVKSSISADRAGSFYFRLQNEDQLLAHANERPFAGWGQWGRSRIFDANGRDVSVTDGIWIIVVGVSGWLGYIATFGLLTVPILLLTLRRRRLDPSLATSGLALVLAANLIDMIPNATLTPVSWLIAGALAGRSAYGVAPTRVAGATRHYGHRARGASALARHSLPQTDPAGPE